MLNLYPNIGGDGVHGGTKFSSYTAAVVTGTALVSTYSATSGPNSTEPGLTMSCSGTSATLNLASPSFNVPADEGFLVLSVTLKVSNTANSTVTPIVVVYKDVSGNTLVTHTPIAGAAAANTSAHIQYSAASTPPVGAAAAVVTFVGYNWTSTGGYNVIASNPQILVP